MRAFNYCHLAMRRKLNAQTFFWAKKKLRGNFLIYGIICGNVALHTKLHYMKFAHNIFLLACLLVWWFEWVLFVPLRVTWVIEDPLDPSETLDPRYMS